MFAFDDPEQGRRVLNMAVPIAAEGVTVLDNWDTLGMRGTGSNDVVLEDVFVPDERVLANRPYGVIDPPLQVIFSIAFPIIAAVYLGVAEAAYAAAVDGAAHAGRRPVVQRQVGLMAHRLRIASLGPRRRARRGRRRPAPGMETVAAVWPPSARSPSPASRSATSRWRSPAAPRSSGARVIERCYRDIRAAKFHPLTPGARLCSRRAAGARPAGGVPRVNATDGRSLRRVLRRVPTSVTVVCTLDGTTRVGHTIGSFVSASLDPPLVGYFAMRSSATLGAVRRSGVFSVNVLGEHQVELARRVRRPLRVSPSTACGGSAGPHGRPHLVGAVAVLDCDVDQVLTVGDHELVIGRVVAATVRAPGRGPLLFSGGRFRALSGSAPVQLSGAAAATPSWERAG